MKNRQGMKSFTLIKKVLRTRPYFRYFLLLWLITISIFLWLVNLNLLAYIVSSPVLTPFGKIDFIFDTYTSFFTISNPVSLSRLFFSLLLAINLTLLVFLWRAGQRQGVVRSNSGALIAMIGSHCVACGTSLVAPLVTALAGSGAYLSAERFATTQLLATGANVLGIILIAWSIRGVAKRIAGSELLVRVNK